MNTEQDIETFNKYLNILLDNHTFDNEQIADIKLKFGKISQVYADHDFEAIKSNGYRSTIHCLASMVKICIEEHSSKPHFESVFKFVHFILDQLINCIEMSKISEDKTYCPLINDHHRKYFDDLQKIGPELHQIIPNYCGRFFMPSTQLIYKNLIPIATYLKTFSMMDNVISLINSDYRHKTLAHKATTRSMDETIQFFLMVNNYFAKLYHGAYSYIFHSDISRRDHQVDFVSTFELKLVETPNVDIVIDRNETGFRTSSLPVRVRIYGTKTFDHQTRSKVVLHAQGGAYVSGSPETTEPYLLDMVRMIPEAVVVSVDYGKAPICKFPTPLQQLLDVYSWLTSGDTSVIETIGFQPDDIVFFGDSSGATLLISLLCVIADIQHQWSDSNLKLPSAILSVYGSLTLSWSLLPSHLTTTADPILNHLSFIRASEAVSPFSPIFEDQDDRYVKHEQFQLSPYLSPIHYKHWERLMSVNLVLYTSSLCPGLDINISMAKKWLGPVSLEVADREPHGFMTFYRQSKTATAATLDVSDQLRSLVK